MISNLFRAHPDVLSLSEFYALVSDGQSRAEVYESGDMDGLGFWEVISKPASYIEFLLRNQRSRPAEILYRYEAPTSRFVLATGVPPILLTCLPHLDVDAEGLLDELKAEITAAPRVQLADHYRQLFGILARRYRKKMWVERSGASLNSAPKLLALFPDARFIHIVRDGRDVAVSLQRNRSYRIAYAFGVVAQHLGVDPLVSADRSNLGKVPEQYRCFLPEAFDQDALEQLTVPWKHLGKSWSNQIATGCHFLGQVPPERVRVVRYEDFLAAPCEQAGLLAAFLGPQYVQPDWIESCADLIKQPASQWRGLPPDERADLNAACAAGFEALAACGIAYPRCPPKQKNRVSHKKR